MLWPDAVKYKENLHYCKDSLHIYAMTYIRVYSLFHKSAIYFIGAT